MDPRFKFLRLLATIYKVLAWLGAVGGILALLFLLFSSQTDIDYQGMEHAKPAIGAGQAVVLLMATALHFVVFIGFSQAIEALLEILDRSLQAAKRSSEAVAAIGPIDIRLQKIERHLEEG